MTEDEYLDRGGGSGPGAGMIIGIALVILLVGGAFAVIMTVYARQYIAALVILVAIVVATRFAAPLIVAPLSGGRVRLTRDGLLTSGPLIQRMVAWDDITGIEILETRRGRLVGIQLTDGTRRRLAAPKQIGDDDTAAFEADVARIHRWWTAGRTPES